MKQMNEYELQLAAQAIKDAYGDVLEPNASYAAIAAKAASLGIFVEITPFSIEPHKKKDND